MKAILTVLFSLFTTISYGEIVRFQKVDSILFRSSQPELTSDYDLYRTNGIKTIINLRNDDSVGPSDQRAQADGFLHIHIPLNADSNHAQYLQAMEQFLSIVHNPSMQPVLVHCRYGKDRTGLAVALYRVFYQGYSPQEAFAEWREIGLSDEWGKGIQDFFWQAIQHRQWFENFDIDLNRPEIAEARNLKLLNPSMSPRELAAQTFVPKDYKDLLLWMKKDLEYYRDNFDLIFESKLSRIRAHEFQRKNDLNQRLKPLYEKLKKDSNNQEIQIEIARIQEEYRNFGFAQEYTNAQDFLDKFVGPKAKILKSSPPASELAKMNRLGSKILYVDTWSVPFFNTATQTREQAYQGIQKTLTKFQNIDFSQNISLLEYTELVALFARPEFDDIRRFKLKFFPTQQERKHFANERSDAMLVGDQFPNEVFSFTNKALRLDPLSLSFGQRLHAMGLISHAKNDALADGRIFTGPADFLEHDQAHAFFNLAVTIPGSTEDWQKVHDAFFYKMNRETNPSKRLMMSIVYFHLTHESGFRTLLMTQNLSSFFETPKFDNLINDIREKIQTRYYYDWVPTLDVFQGGYEEHLKNAFAEVSAFFKYEFAKIYFKSKSKNERIEISKENSFKEPAVNRCSKLFQSNFLDGKTFEVF